MNISIYRKLFISHFLAVLLVSGTIGTYFYLSATGTLISNLQTRLKNSAALVSQTIDAHELDQIRDASHVDAPHYMKYLVLLRDFQRTNDDISFIYAMRLEEDGAVRFVVDSDDTEEQALPGKVYKEITPELARGFWQPSVDEKIYQDEWGLFMSGYAPVKGTEGLYLVGIDMRADAIADKLYTLRKSGLVSLCLSIFLALLFSRTLASHFNGRLRSLIDRCNAMAEGKPGKRVETETSRDELENLLRAFDEMSTRVQLSQQENFLSQQKLTKAKQELEMKVAERTAELTKLNDTLRHEIAEKEKAQEILARAARSDHLTGLLNRRAMMEHLQYLVHRFERTRRQFSILMVDLDHFKAINDVHGHDVGDRVLVAVAAEFTRLLRKQDMVSRWGGEEFLIALPETGHEGAWSVAEKIREGFAGHPLRIDGMEIGLTVSIGVVSFDGEESMEACIKAADSALYEAKWTGRDRVMAVAR